MEVINYYVCFLDYPMNFSIEWINSNAIVTMTGEVGFEEIDFVNGKLYGDSRYERMEYQLFNMTDVEKFNLTARDFEMIGVLDRNSSIWNNRMKVAVVFRNEEMIRLMDFYKRAMKDTNWKIEVFRELDDAMNWCNGNLVGELKLKNL